MRMPAVWVQVAVAAGLLLVIVIIALVITGAV